MYSASQKTCHAATKRWTVYNLSAKYESTNSKLCGTHAYADQVFACCPPTPICLAWWTIFVPLDCVSMSSSGKLDPQTKEYKSLNAALGELHYELLLCSVDNTSSPSTSSGHRHGSGSNPINTSSGSSAGYTTFANWSLSCFRKQQPTKDYHYLELFVQHVSKRCLKPIDTKVSSCPTSELHLKQSCLDIKEDLAITRTIEFLQLAWISGRLRNLGTDDFTRLLSPLAEHKLIHLQSHDIKLKIGKNRSAVARFQCLTSMSPEGNTRAVRLPKLGTGRVRTTYRPVSQIAL
ncbi:hypothetical protein T265_06140 [Opisthorchis viverrini]|uniref:Uncharacterized protein n=1 Tax=Opisthorchis viverrini TaxID=6198 RepID=A0A074ZTD1_OPIVI|nr:hypothetical protein T265_06140 [Opisthorchis viverrini]KER26635.1 hypothetical protein T265_06140 [Opisthorchis viverrini]